MNAPHLLDAFRDVAELVRRGTTLLGGDGVIVPDYDGWVSFAKNMVPLVMPAAEFVGRLAAGRLYGPIRVLDIAAGHGMFGICVAQKNPEAIVVGLDWENVLSVALDNAQRAGLRDRYTALPGNALTIDFGGDYDLVLVSNFFHHFDETTCKVLMRKVSSCLRPKGLVMTLEFVPNEDRISPDVPAGFSFTMLGTTPRGEAHTFAAYEEMWSAVGLTQNELVTVPISEHRVIVSAR